MYPQTAAKKQGPNLRALKCVELQESKKTSQPLNRSVHHLQPEPFECSISQPGRQAGSPEGKAEGSQFLSRLLITVNGQSSNLGSNTESKLRVLGGLHLGLKPEVQKMENILHGSLTGTL